MLNDNEWNLIYSDFIRDNVNPLPLIVFPSEVSKHTIRIEVNATEIRPTWKTAGWLYHRISPPSDNKRDIAGEFRVLVNCRNIFKLPELTNTFWLEYQPARWYLWQDIKIWHYIS